MERRKDMSDMDWDKTFIEDEAEREKNGSHIPPRTVLASYHNYLKDGREEWIRH